eukprot:CAMPEP_0185586182 /NCGR_PEP_ID=MMETSP0434-20130131/42927_1 /TAXON_ID=626734 ORGANISM="Favella taraikaensis, Strain Fe Narragansett Bay" /NCGR_SAMPLE_ID=MMETSP0434 /ASSEMBLY_ACC=CAM_ASM_000379 /LENGTH=49 /DNA_ID=CAMNT_0028207105 /DNA_START=274 /DNA_END=423 /DNA_ORIENTATION=-
MSELGNQSAIRLSEVGSLESGASISGIFVNQSLGGRRGDANESTIAFQG